MEYKKRLIKLMEWQSKKLEKYSKIPYFTEKDKKAIEKWDETTCKIIWNLFVSFIKLHKHEGLDWKTNPFCLYNLLNVIDCKDCPYGENHGICNDENSDYMKLLDELHIKHLIATNNIFTNKCYHAFIRHAEGKNIGRKKKNKQRRCNHEKQR